MTARKREPELHNTSPEYWESLPRPGWDLEAACFGMDTELFFSNRGCNGFGDERKVCARCPVVDDCVVDAIRHENERRDLRDGLRGGRSGVERWRLEAQLQTYGINLRRHQRVY